MISIVIPTLQSGPQLKRLLDGIRAQIVEDEVEVIVVDSGSSDGTPQLARSMGARVHEIPPAEFSHGGARNLGVRLACGELIVFTVQDAMPVGTDWLERLVGPLRPGGGAAATYSRQIPRQGAPAHQRFYIEYRFGRHPRVQQASGPADLDVGTTMFSNVSSAIRTDLIRRLRFAEDIVVGEDGEWCARVLLAGHTVEYVPGSVIEHSHDYSLGDAFKRYFDLGASSERTFLAAGRSSAGAVRNEGIQFVRREVRSLWSSGDRARIPYTLAHEASRWLGFKVGMRHRSVPPFLRPRLSRTPTYWRRLDDETRQLRVT